MSECRDTFSLILTVRIRPKLTYIIKYSRTVNKCGDKPAALPRRLQGEDAGDGSHLTGSLQSLCSQEEGEILDRNPWT